MSWSGILGKTAVGLGAVAVPVVFAVAGAGQASADPGICVSGPWGYASACINGPGWVDWGPHWNGGRANRWGNRLGNGDGQREKHQTPLKFNPRRGRPRPPTTPRPGAPP